MGYKLQFQKNFFLVFILILYITRLFAQPSISSFSPTKGPIGSIVTIRGTGFSPTGSNNVVLFSSVRAHVTAATSNTLTVIVPNGAISGKVTVTNNNLTTISTNFFLITFPSCIALNSSSFSSKTDIITGDELQNVFTTDIDIDGKPDVITVNNYSNNISIFRNNSSTEHVSFYSKINLETSYYQKKVVLFDVDGDAKPEIIVSNTSSSTISIFKNLCSPGVVAFAAGVDFKTAYYAIEIAFGDVDEDGKIDVALAFGNSNTVSLLRNTSSNGIISFASKIDFNTGSLSPRNLSICDLNRDGKLDLAIASLNYNNDSISIFKNTSIPGTISCAKRISFPNEGGSTSLSISDIDSDNYPDIVTTSSSFNQISVFRNGGITESITFTPKKDFVSGASPQSISIGDFNGDGKPDLVSANSSSNTISIFENNSAIGTITFLKKIDYTTETYPTGIAVADFDLNGRPDLVVASNSSTVSIFRKTTSQQIFLVDSSRTKNNTAIGLCNVGINDWTNACGSLQSAINAAQEGDQVWVAKGTYIPSQDSVGNTKPLSAKAMTFVMKSGVKVYGGFASKETELEQRNSSKYATILSGQLNISGVPTKVNNVVWFKGVQNTTVLNGFTIKNGFATNNSAGAGIYLISSSPVISNCIVTGNSSNDLGGAMYLNNASPVLINCSIYNNIAPYGGAIATVNSSPVIINCTIVKNAASITGGGIYNQEGSPNIINSIVWGNTGLNNLTDNVNSLSGNPVVTYSIIGQKSGIFPGTGNKNTNPLFVDGVNENFYLIKGSCAVTGGSISSYPSIAPVTDLAGNPRVDETISIGAYQGAKNALINSTGLVYINQNKGNIFANGYSWASAYASLSDAFVVANNNNVSEMWVAKGSYIPTNDSSSNPTPDFANNSTFAIKRGFRLFGGFSGTETKLSQQVTSANETILDGFDSTHSTYSSSVIYVSNADSSNIIDGFTIKNAGYDYTIGGAALFIQQSTVAINNCRIINNECGIRNWYGKLKSTNCYFNGNRNGGVYGGAISNNSSTADIINCNFYENVPSGNYAYGGAISNSHSLVTILNCNFEKNRAIHLGGTIYNSDSSNSIIKNCKFIANEAANGKRGWYGGSGGAVGNYISNTVFVNCIFVKNEAGTAGAIDNLSSVSTVINCSFSNNTASYYGGIYNRGNSKTNISNSISWGNLSEYYRTGDNLFDNETQSPKGSFTVDHSIIGFGTGIYPGTGNLNLDPKFVDTTDANLKLISGSPAIEAGDNTSYTGNLKTDFDVEGVPRLEGTTIDIGANEYTTTIVKNPPSIRIINPADNITFTAPVSIIMTAVAEDKDGRVRKVEFYKNDTLIGSATASPYTFTWNDVPAGNYFITAKATDNDSLVTTSGSVQISVNNPKVPPTVSITDPVSNSTFSAPASITFRATAEDADGSISKVDFYSNDTLVGSATASPYTFTWNDVPAGNFRIFAIATDNNGLSTTSRPATVKVLQRDSIVVKIIPNPATTTINISASGFDQNKSLTLSIVYFGAIQKIIEVNSSSQSIQLDVSSFVSGVYTLKLTCGDKVVSRQFIKL